MSTATCPFCTKDTRVTAAGEFRVHGPHQNRCEGSGTTPVNGPDLEPKIPEPREPTIVLGTLAHVSPVTNGHPVPVASVTIPDKTVGSDVSSHIEGSAGLQPDPMWREHLATLAEQLKVNQAKAHIPEGFDESCPQCQADNHRCPGCGEPIKHGNGCCDECAKDAFAPLQAPESGHPVLAPPTPEITATRLAQAQERVAVADAQVKARRQPATPAWTGAQRIDSLGANAILGKREAIAGAIELVKLQVPLACDIETEGLGIAARSIKCVIFSDVPRGETSVILDPRDPDQAKVATWIFDNVPELVFHNSPYDVPQLVINGLFRSEHAAKVTDTLIYARGAEPGETVSKSLGSCAQRYLGLPYDKKGMLEAGRTVGMRGSEQIFREMDLDRPVYARGAATDAVVTARLVGPLRRAYYDRLTSGHPFTEWGVQGAEADHLVEREQKLNRMSLRRMARGYRVDLEYLDSFNERHAAKLDQAAGALKRYHVRPTNAQDLLTFLDGQNLIPADYPRTKKTEKPSGDKNHLPMLQHPLVGVFLWHKEQTHILHDYLEKVRDLSVSVNGYDVIFPVTTYFGAVTGRMSMGEPPVHQFPGAARGVLLGHWSSIDWSQIEPVVAANVAGELAVLDGYENHGKKFYTVVEDLTGIPYKQAKAQLLGTLYGQGKKLTAAKLGVSLAEAEAIESAIFAPMPKIYQLTRTLREIGEQYQMVPTISGRITPVPSGYYKGRYSVQTHKAVNYFVQGSAYDVLAESGLEVENQGLGDALNLFMHDELVVDTEAAHDIQKIMETPPARLVERAGRVPILRTDLQDLGERWAAA